MPLPRYPWALAALALTLVLSACSTPADLTAPTLEPQFGTSDNDFGADVAYVSSGRVYVLSEQEGSYETCCDYQDDYYLDDVDTTVLSRYDNNGNLVWSRDLLTEYCSEDCSGNPLQAHALVADTRGYSYALVSERGGAGYDESTDYEECAVAISFRVYKYDAAGNAVRSVYAGQNGSPYYGSTGATLTDAADLAVDGSGNLYIARQEIAFTENACEGERSNVVAKYSATGVLQWQRLSTVGTLYSVTVSSNGNVYVAGSGGVAKYTNSGNQGWKISGDTRDVTAVGTNTVYARNLTTVRKLDANGKQLWSKAQTGLSGLVIADMTTDSSANVYITGKYNASSGNRDVFTRKLAASSGATSFSKTFGASIYDDARGIATINGSEIYLTGATKGPLAPPYQGGEQDGYVRELSSTGNPVWTR